MASDSLNQVGKYIRKTGKDADRAVKRAYPIQPRLERIRDIFDSSTAFEMQFDTTSNDKRVLLDLFFTLPPPIRGCKSGCIFSKCGERSIDAGSSACVCGITDTFTRLTDSADGPGTSDAGIIWDSFSSIPLPYCNGEQLVIQYGKMAFLDLQTNDLDFTLQFTMSSLDFIIEAGPDGSVVVIEPEEVTIGHASGDSDNIIMAIGNGVWNVRVSVSSSHIKTKLWQGAEEPASWTLELTGLTPVDDPASLAFFNTEVGNPSSQVDLFIDNLDIEGITICPSEFDTFERDDVNFDWGTGTDGGIWFDGGPGTGTRSIQSGYGHIRHDSSTAGQTYTYRTTTASGGTTPWTQNFAMTAQFKILAVGTPPTGNTHIMVADGAQQGGDGPTINFGGGASLGFFYFNDIDPPTTAKTWSIGAEYFLKWERSAGGTINKVKTWGINESEPSNWDIESTTTLPVTPNAFQIYHTGGDHIIGPTEIAFGSILFAGTDGACYPCGTIEFDNFNRSASGNWGISTTGYTWRDFGGFGYQAGTTISVNGSAARISRVSGQTQQSMELPGATPPFQTGFEMTMRFRCSPIYTGDSNLAWSIQPVSEVGSAFFTAIISNGTAFGPTHNGRLVTGAGDIPKFDWIADVWYTAKIYESPELRQAKLWSDSETEPDWQVSLVSLPEDFVVRSGWFAITLTGPAMASEYVEIDDIIFTGICSYGESGTGSSVDGECFTLNHPYVPGSVSVMIDGVTLPASQVNESNPEAGEVCIQGISGVLDITVCYMYKEGCT